MQLQNDNKTRIAYLGALALLFSYAEMFIPKIVPFFRLGLGNIVILLAFDFSFPSFLLLNLIKIIANSMLSGTLFSPFFLISFAQGYASGIVMYILAKIFRNGKLLGVYGISLAGSAVSAVIQILTSSLYLGTATFSLLGPMLIFSIFSGFITAFLAIHLQIPQNAPELRITTSENEKFLSNRKVVAISVLILITVTLVMMMNSLILLGIMLTAAFVFQVMCRRKIYWLPHIGLWIFVIIFSLITPNGIVIVNLLGFSITEGALVLGVEKSLKLSIIMALSQGAASLKPKPDSKSLLNLTLLYFGGFSNVLRSAEGKLIQKVKIALSAQEISASGNGKIGITLLKTCVITAISVILFVLSKLFFN